MGAARLVRRRRAGKGMEAPCGIRETEKSFGIEVIGANRVGQNVGESPLDGAKASRARIADPGDLHRRGFAGEERQPVAGGVATEIDENVDAVAADLLGGARVIQTMQ